MFIASWYLLRLGAFGNPKVNCILGSPDRLIAKELITIVPDYFKSAEDKALEIVSKSKYTDYSPKIKQVFFKSNKKSWSDWNDFDPREYEYRNYGKQILHEDAEIIKNAIQGLEQMDLKRGSLKRVMDIGTGPNLYPTMLLTPYISWDAKIELIEYAKPNLKYLRTVKETGNNKDWIKFEKLMTEMGGEKYKGSINKLLSISEIKEGNIFRLPKNTYDAVVSFFVTESITDDREKFKESLLSLINSLKPGGIIVAAHMVNSREYFAGENTRFPATNLSVNEIEEAYKGLADISLSLIGHTGFKPARKGYKGMALIIGRKITSTS
jgi:hypothetical protein